jgi:hypothetical protein
LKLVLELIMVLYGILLMYAAFSMLKKGHNVIGIIFLLCGVGLLLSIYLKSVFLLAISLICISFVSWINAPKIVNERNLSHHFTRTIFHLIVFGLWIMSN